MNRAIARLPTPESKDSQANAYFSLELQCATGTEGCTKEQDQSSKGDRSNYGSRDPLAAKC